MSASTRYKIKHRKDVLLNRGYQYSGNILKRTLSPALFLEDKRSNILGKFEEYICFLINSIKHIKKSYYWTVEKDDLFIN